MQIELARAQHAQRAHQLFLSIFVNVVSKGSLNYIPKLEIAGSSPVACSISIATSQDFNAGPVRTARVNDFEKTAVALFVFSHNFRKIHRSSR